MFNNGTSSLKFFKRLNIYKSGKNHTFHPTTMQAWSYNWCYLTKINDKVVFNNYKYSNTTNNHQEYMRALCKRLGIKIDIFCYGGSSIHTKDGLLCNLSMMYLNVFKLQFEQNYARDKNKHSTQIDDILKNIDKLKDIGIKLVVDDIESLEADVIKALSAARDLKSEHNRKLRLKRQILSPDLKDTSSIDLSFFKNLNNTSAIKFAA